MSESQPRKALHRRSIEHQTWRHEDGALEIESRLVDSKAYDTRIGFHQALPAGTPVHDMTIRLLLEPNGVIRDISVHMARTPFDICPEIIQRFEGIRGTSVGRGWNALLSERFSGILGCRHLIDLLRGMGTVVFQSLSREVWTQEALDWMVDSCHAFRQEGPVMVRLSGEVARDDESE